eukprot:TRINITY_DN6501_c0_g1_i3.p1 TRINITY_DN6501_c0_g1~~TRINITY_DN6501_c0_g1_i3.p1  ORF type:complete len:239 (+),score=49.65 TRINITY_DN6501_c0_g1_i3:313-1029(+)
MALAGSKCIVFGATGEIGRGAAVAFLKHGARAVAIVGRNAGKIAHVKSQHLGDDDRVIAIAGDHSTWNGAQKVFEDCSAALDGQIDHVVHSSGPWWKIDSMQTLPLETYRQAFQANVDTHYFAYRAFVNHVNQSFLFVNGAAANMLPATQITGVCAATVQAMLRVFAQEASEHQPNLRLHEILVNASVGHAEQRQQSMDPVEFGEVFVAVALGKAPGQEPQKSLIVDDDDVAKFVAVL